MTDADLLGDVTQFLYLEARLADESRYDEWEALWTDDAVYWVPANGPSPDPTTSMSIIFDNRSRIATRIRQLKTGKRYSQSPPSSLRRLVSNVEILDSGGQDNVDVSVGSNFVVYESRDRGLRLWAGRAEHRLRSTADGWRMAAKTVVLVDNDRALDTLSFLI